MLPKAAVAVVVVVGTGIGLAGSIDHRAGPPAAAVEAAEAGLASPAFLAELGAALLLLAVAASSPAAA